MRELGLLCVALARKEAPFFDLKAAMQSGTFGHPDACFDVPQMAALQRVKEKSNWY